MTSLKTWLIIGILLRLLLMPFTVHPDLRGHYLGASFIVLENDLFGLYDHISRLPRSHPLVNLYHDDFLVYSPLTYSIHAAWLKVVQPFISWDLFSNFIMDIGSAVRQSGFPQLVFILKFPYLLVDVFCFWLISRLVDAKYRLQATVLWTFNLPILHSAFMMGQFDIFIVAALLLVLLFIKHNRLFLPAVFVALSAGFKPFTIFLLPFLPGKLWHNLLVGGLTYLLIIAIYLPSPGFRLYALVAQHSDKLWFAKILVSGSQYLPLFIIGVVLLFWLKYFSPKLFPNWAWLMLPLLLFYSVTHFHPQWFTWVTPFLLLSFLTFPKTRPLLASLLVCWFIVVLSFESSLNFGLFGLDISIPQLLNRYYPFDQFMSFVRGVLAATSISLFVLMSKTRST